VQLPLALQRPAEGGGLLVAQINRETANVFLGFGNLDFLEQIERLSKNLLLIFKKNLIWIRPLAGLIRLSAG
jgi:hypothetical protein